MGAVADTLPGGNHWGLTISNRFMQPGTGGWDQGAGAKLLWHTTESGKGLGTNVAEDMIQRGVEPHGLLDPHTGEFWQFHGSNVWGKALKHTDYSSAVGDTNKAKTYQVELLCDSVDVPKFGDKEFAHMGALTVLLEHRLHIPRHCVRHGDGSPVSFTYGALRLSEHDFFYGSGHCGHMHAPENDHVDPGHLDIHKVFAAAAKAGPR